MTTAVSITTTRGHTARKWGGGAEVQKGGRGFPGGRGPDVGIWGVRGRRKIPWGI